MRIEYGGIAQLGERLNGIQEVSGSIPLISTKSPENQRFSGLFSSETVHFRPMCIIFSDTAVQSIFAVLF